MWDGYPVFDSHSSLMFLVHMVVFTILGTSSCHINEETKTQNSPKCSLKALKVELLLKKY